ncbi:MAG: glycosyltransferase family 2 protein [Candidatus Beckwithbacteria bacterium]|nr:glycosyltransferase family 2 protein [Candidatus Beckwithbacteria bacterium]
MKVIICIPTYNEKDNIASTIDGLEESFKKIPPRHQLQILVIDDHSPDGTAAIVSEKKAQYGNVVLLPNKEKKGLGAAYIKAFKYAMEKLSADVVFEYDADGSHQPQYIPGMIKVLDEGADVVIGSRYVQGGSMPADWGLHRKFLSYFGNFIARFVLFTPQYKDMTTGYRGTKTKWLKQLDLDNLFSKQFAYKIQLYYELHRLGAKIVEYPITFIDRSQGKSKFPRNNIIDSLKVVFKLRLRDSQKLIKVMVVGGIGTLVQLLFFNLLRLKISLSLSQNLAIEMAVISNFILNNIWTFKEDKFNLKEIKKLLVGFIKFNILSLGSIIIQNLVLLLGIKLLGRSFLAENGLVLTGILLGLIWNYLMYTRVVWKK